MTTELTIKDLIEFVHEFRDTPYFSSFIEKTTQEDRNGVLWFFIKSSFLQKSVKIFTNKMLEMAKLNYEEVKLKLLQNDELTKCVLYECSSEFNMYDFLKNIREKLDFGKGSSIGLNQEIKRYEQDAENLAKLLKEKVIELQNVRKDNILDKERTGKMIKNLEIRLEDCMKELDSLKNKIYESYEFKNKLDDAMINASNYMIENRNLKEEIKKQTLLMIKSESIKKEDIEKHNYQSFLHTIGIGELEIKLQELFDINKKLSKENSELRILKDEFINKIKILEKKENEKFNLFKEQLTKLFEEFNEKEKNIADFYLYILYKKRKNRDHREKIKKHLESDCCKKRKDTHFFSFPIRDVLYEILKEKGFEDITFIDEKNCCKDAGILILKAIDFLCVNYGGKCNLWYRNFLIKKFIKKNYENMKISNLNKKAIDERFYWTYLSEYVCNKKIKLEQFIEDKHKFINFHKQYEKLDKQINGKIRYYHLTSEILHKINQNNKAEVFNESITYLKGSKKLPVFYEKQEKWNYQLALSRIGNVKYKNKIKKIIKKLIVLDKLLPKTQKEKDQDFVTKYIDSGILQQYNDKINQINDKKQILNIVTENVSKNLVGEVMEMKNKQMEYEPDFTDSDSDTSDSDFY